MFNKLKQFKQVKETQAMLRKEAVDGTAGWGKVKVTVNAALQVTNVQIDPDALANRESLQGMIKEAVNDALPKAIRLMQKTVKESGNEELLRQLSPKS
ncbi:MAG: YbaB/EbfC family nucleoid-associated protein [Candidatus Uhrbacteria bacterium]|nr:YbaB/EbfC family nucleoid-associated protein [Candidatus Uhrbacteria bacterium]